MHRSVPGPLCTHYNFQISILMGFQSGQTSGFLILVLSLRHFYFCFFVLSNYNVLDLFYVIFSYFDILCFILIVSLRGLVVF